ncbi:class A beta-lactamase-related serine hydrolase [Flavobacterium sp. xlx-214]|uniref:serine hydrolase n=1 Tax=unclassified Flavobacterium TaxID=196869 RepID=UPI0013D178D1|nr:MULTISPECIES: serine hydrolase [unclassified Flavobacterium]MBA5793438.1 class A beta-lactamase-related serine hydrolase [Flavobacterium sp. xlx-221]QMI82790.1 class A beta-lactamase-related serine hydrolase [Flavobacterium sp. xlx-214]
MSSKISFGILFLIICSNKIFAQTENPTTLYKTILSKDSLLFEVGFNQCNITQFENLLSENLKFYHDKDGISDKAKFIADLKKGICDNLENRQVKRFLIRDKTEIFPLYKNGELYGAVQNGEHSFSEKRENQAGIAKFTNLWELENGEWKLKESFSFDHQPISEAQKTANIFDNNSAIENWLLENKIKTLGLGIIENGKLKQVKVFGEISKGNSAPYNTIFNVASLTKPITTMVALKLVSEGKWNLDEPIYNYFTDADIAKDPRNKKLTTRLILSHQTGFPNWRSETENKKLQFLFEPGTKYGYSGEGFEYLRKAIEKKFKKPLEKLAEELVFQPLKMKDSDLIWTKNTDESRFAIGYDENGNPYQTIKNTTANAADDLHTTIKDYGNFLVNILNGGNLSENVYLEMLKKQVKTKDNKYFGLGFEMYDLGNGEMAISHGGSDLGTQCITFLFTKTKNGILIFTNSTVGYKIFNPLLIHYLGENGKKLIDIESK